MEDDDKQKELEALQASIEKLEAKNKELVGELRKAKGSTNEEAARLADELDAVKAENIKLKGIAEKATAKVAQVEQEMTAALNGEKSAVSKLLIDNGLTEALTEIGVKPGLMSAAKALLRDKGIFQIESEGDVRRAVAALKKDGKDVKLSLKDYMTEFAATEEAKEFIAAEAAAGGGAKGGAGKGGSGQKKTQAQIDAMSPVARSEFFAAGGTSLG